MALSDENQRQTQLMSSRGIKYVSMHGPGGYAVAAKRYMLALAKAGIKVSWTPMVAARSGPLGYAPSFESSSPDPELSQYCNAKFEYDTVVVHMVPEYYPLWRGLEPDKKIIGCTVWETDLIPKHWKDLLNICDSLIVPCNWNREVFIKDGVTTPIAVIPHVALPTRKKDVQFWPNIGENEFVFYTINTWTIRKSIWLTIEAFLKAFTARDPVCLVIKSTIEDYTVPARRWRKLFGLTERPLVKKRLQKILAGYENPAKIIYIDEVLSDHQIDKLHQRGNCYVSLCRSEGWGIGAFDACAYGSPVIITGFGGQVEYLPDEYANLVRYKLVNVVDPIAPDSYREDSFWAEPDIPHAIEILRSTFENQKDAKEKALKLQSFVCREFSESKIGPLFSGLFA